MPKIGHTYLYDGGTGQRFDQPCEQLGYLYGSEALGTMVNDKYAVSCL